MGTTVSSYVHSNIEHGHWKEFNGYETPRLLAEKSDVDAAIKRLEAVKKELEEEANDFLGNGGIDFLNYCVDNEYHTYAQIAVQLLQEPDAITALLKGETSLQMDKDNIETLLSQIEDKVLKKRIEDFINIEKIELIGVRTLAREVAEAISDSSMVLTVNGSDFTKDLYKGATGRINNDGLDGKVLKEITGVAVNQLSSGKSSSRIIDAIEAIIKKAGLHKQMGKQQQKQYKDSIDSFMDWFKTVFLAKAKAEIKFYEVDQSPEDYLKAYESKIRNQFKKGTKTFKETDTKNAVGALGDEFYVSAYQADAYTAVLKIEIASIGSVKESEVVSKYQKTFNGVQQMLTHHNPDKQSQTDILIRNQAGKTIRVQAKNASLRNAEFSNNGLINLGAHLERDRKLIALLQALEIPNIENIAYTVTNSLWFSAHDSVTGVRDSGKLKVTKVASANDKALSNLEQELSIFFSTKAENFLGVTLNKAVDAETKILSGASNIFFLKNGRFIPTYTLVDEVIADLEHYRDDGLSSLQGLNFKIIKPGDTVWKFNDDEDFWIEKAKQDFANRIAVGTEQGAGAISSIEVHGTFPRVHALSSLKVSVN